MTVAQQPASSGTPPFGMPADAGAGDGLLGRSRGDRVYRGAITLAALSVPLLLVAIAVSVVAAGWPALRRFGPGFLTSGEWNVVAGQFGALPALFGTVVSSLLALVIATPLALGVAVFLSEFAPAWLRQPIAFLVDLLAAVPSVVYGLWGVFVLIPLLREHVMPFLATTLGLANTPFFTGPAYGPSMLAAGLILAIMVLPYISAVSREVLLAVPRSPSVPPAGRRSATPSCRTRARASSAASSSAWAARSARRWP